ncbi:MAG TPA: LPS assembly protein LptD [Myxococcaceae bacterium]
MIAALLAARLALAQAPYATELETAAGERVDLTADLLSYDDETQVITVRGHALLRTDRATLRADEIRYVRGEQRAVARGQVLLALGLMVAVAEEIDLDVRSLEATVTDGAFLQKRDVAPEALRAAETAEALRALGRTSLVIRGRRIQRLGPNHFAVDGISFTPCDCAEAEPTWRIQAARADVQLGERVTLAWPVVYVYGVPVLPLPWAYLPLSDRRTGFLVPRIDATYLTGLALQEPLFITLGESADVTLTPGWFFGGSSKPFGVRGPRLLTELRYTPSETTAGRALVGVLYDLRPRRDPVDPSLVVPGTRNGLRFEGALQHAQELGGGFDLRADLSVVSDGYYVKDLTPDVLLREAQYLRSTAALARRGADQYAGLELALRQDTRFGYRLDPAIGPATLQRLPAYRWVLLDGPLWGPVSFGLGAELSREAPIWGGTGDEGTDGVFDPLHPDLDGSQGDRRFQPGEREARDRLDLRPRLAATFQLGDVAQISPYLAYREDLYVGEASGQFAHRGYPMGGVAVDTQLSRTFAGGAFRHTLTPSLELRSVPVVFGAPLGRYDELDEAVPPSGLLQAVAEVNQRLLARQGSQVSELLRLDLAQGYDLLERRLGDTSARAGLHAGWLGADATARYSVPEGRFTQLAASLGADDGRGRRAYARYERLLIDGSERQRRGVDALVGPADPSPSPERAELLTAGGAYRFPFGLTIGYDAILSPNQPAGARLLDSLTWQALSASYSPSCECWRIDLSLSLTHRTKDDPWLPGWGLHFTLARLGSAGI